MNCIKCQVPLPEGAKFCAACGMLQPEPRPTPAPGKDLCAGCGAPLEPGAAFCASCGTPVPATAPAAPAVCAGCGSPLESGAVFCAKCGTPVPAPVLQKAPLSPKAKKAVFIGGGALAAVIALVVILVVVLSGGANSSPEAVAEAYLRGVRTNDYEAVLECATDATIRRTLQYYGSRSSSELEGKSRSELTDLFREDFIDNPDSPYSKNRIDPDDDVTVTKTEITETVSSGTELSQIRSTLSAVGYTEEECKSLTEAAVVKLTYKWSQSESEETETITITCAKFDGDWYVLE